MTALADAYLFLVGAALGSFLHLAADRLPRREPVLRGRSRCRSCGRTLNAADLVPLASFAWRRGRCATCGAAIPRSAPLAELAGGAALLLPALALGPLEGGACGLALLSFAGAAVALTRARA